MALIKCPECGKEISNAAQSCPNCGFSLKQKNASVGLLIIGIIFIVLSIFVLFQSCAAGMVNAVQGNAVSDGLIGTFTAIFMLVTGIVSIATRKNENVKFFLIWGIIIAVYGFLIGYIYKGIYRDLNIFGYLIFASSLVYFYRFKKLK